MSAPTPPTDMSNTARDMAISPDELPDQFHPGTVFRTRTGLSFEYVGPEMHSPGKHKHRRPTGRHILRSLQTGATKAATDADLHTMSAIYTVSDETRQKIAAYNDQVLGMFVREVMGR